MAKIPWQAYKYQPKSQLTNARISLNLHKTQHQYLMWNNPKPTQQGKTFVFLHVKDITQDMNSHSYTKDNPTIANGARPSWCSHKKTRRKHPLGGSNKDL